MRELRTVPHLFIDCQTTGPYTNQGKLLEIAWRLHRNGQVMDAFNSFVKLPPGTKISRPVKRLTGLSKRDTADGISQQALRERLQRTLDSVEDVLLILHYARFEQPFLQELLDYRLPPLYCTYKLARRLLSNLPRLGIVSLAGYFGHYLEQRYQAAHHVAATEAIFAGLLPLLQNES